jgi:hypothetical protein
MTSLVTKMVDGKGRVSLGKEFAGRLVIIKELQEGTVQITRAEAVPEREAWLHKNPDALRAVVEGIEQAHAGQLTDGPDLKAGQKLVDEIEG